MGTFNAFIFSVVGALMGFLPALMPGAFPAAAATGVNVSELWLEFMGLVLGSLGTFHVIRNEVAPLIVRVMAWLLPPPAGRDAAQPGVILRPVAVGAYADGGAPQRRAA